MNKYESLAMAIQAWATKYQLSDKYAFQLIYAAFLSTPEKFNLLREQGIVSDTMFKDFDDNFLDGYDMNMIEFDLKENVKEIWDECGENWSVITVAL